MRRRRWGYSLRFGGRSRIRFGRQFPVEGLSPEQVRGWLGQDHATAMAAAIFDAAVALQRAGWSLRWTMADARELERLRWVERMVGAYGQPTATYEARMVGPATLVDRTADGVDVSPRMRGGAVLELEAGPIRGGATLERK